MLLRLLCGPAVLLAAQTSSSLQQPRPGCCCVPEACAHEIFCCMLFAVPFLLTSNGQRLKMMPRLLCVPARLLPACSIESSWFPEARLVLRSRVVRARIFLLYVVRRACLTYLQWPAVETFSPASVCSCSPASSRLCMLPVSTYLLSIFTFSIFFERGRHCFPSCLLFAACPRSWLAHALLKTRNFEIPMSNWAIGPSQREQRE